MVTVFVRKIENLSDAEKQNIITSLSAPAQKRLEGKRNEKLYTASLCALSLLSDGQRADLDYADGGRPFFKDICADISISHSASYAAVALSDSGKTPVGIDLEDIIEKSPFPRFLTENERLALESGTPYLNIWTKKEALFKFLNNGSTPFIGLDSTAPELHGAKFVTVTVDSAILTVCTKPHELIKIIKK